LSNIKKYTDMADSDAAHRWRAKALEAFAVAREMSDPQAKAVMVKIANGYEHLALLTARGPPKGEQSDWPEPPQTSAEEQP
jgi:hypothetical protein